MGTQNFASGIIPTDTIITAANRMDHYLARWGFKRNKHTVEPGLYSVGAPDAKSPVFVTANYSLSFDALRSQLGKSGKTDNCYILVLDTKGINVWCAAGKGSFGTDELVKRIEKTGLKDIVQHRGLIVPQLGAPGVAAHEVKKRTGFKVRYGPVRAEDLPEFMENRKANADMRRVNFTVYDRLVLIPVELVGYSIPTTIIAVLLFFLADITASLALVTSVLSGIVLFSLLMPWIPTGQFSTKGYILGGIVALPFVLTVLLAHPENSTLLTMVYALCAALVLPSVTAFISLNFTGATTFTSKTGVKKEIFTYGPYMAWSVAGGTLMLVVFRSLEFFGVML